METLPAPSWCFILHSMGMFVTHSQRGSVHHLLKKGEAMLRQIVSFVIIAGFVVSIGCKRAQLHLVDASVQKPSNVAIYFTVADKAGEPVGGLTAEKFKIYEDGQLISEYESQQTILNPEVATIRYTLLLLDMSGSIVESGQTPLIQEASGVFITGVGEQEKVAIYAFDGRAELIEIADFESSRGRLAGGKNRLSSWKSKDPSTNLNGAVVEASKILAETMENSEVPIRFGTLVVFTDGTDRAHRATSGEAVSAIRNADITAYVIGLGGEVDIEEMKRLGPDGVVHVQDQSSIVNAFSELAERLHKLSQSYYLLSYCSPSRAGRHKLVVKAILNEEETGTLGHEFDAEGFEPDCDPNDKPAFEVGMARPVNGAKGNARQ